MAPYTPPLPIRPIRARVIAGPPPPRLRPQSAAPARRRRGSVPVLVALVVVAALLAATALGGCGSGPSESAAAELPAGASPGSGGGPAGGAGGAGGADGAGAVSSVPRVAPRIEQAVVADLRELALSEGLSFDRAEVAAGCVPVVLVLLGAVHLNWLRLLAADGPGGDEVRAAFAAWIAEAPAHLRPELERFVADQADTHASDMRRLDEQLEAGDPAQLAAFADELEGEIAARGPRTREMIWVSASWAEDHCR